MATLTPNYSLTKPAGTDTVNIDVINNNMDLLDAAVASKETPADAQTKATAAQTAAATYTDGKVGEVTVASIGAATSAQGAKADTSLQTSQLGQVAGVAKQDDLTAHLADYAQDTGTANTYVMTLDPVLTSYVAGKMYKFKATNANTGVSTLNINSLGVKVIKKNVTANLASGDILAGQIITVVYDGTNFQMIPDYSGRVGQASGIAPLGTDGKVPSANLPSLSDGAWVKIAEQTLAAAVAKVDFASIPTGYKNFRLEFEAIADTSAVADLLVTFNDSATAIYYYQMVSFIAGTVASNAQTARNNIYLQSALQKTTGAGYGFRGDLEISNIDPTKAKSVVGRWYTGDYTLPALYMLGGAWSNATTEISKISIAASANNIGVGSRFVLWGVK